MSKHPILEYAYYTGSDTDYKKLIEYRPNPTRVGKINNLVVRMTAGSVGVATFQLKINGNTMFTDKLTATDVLSISWGGDLELDGDEKPEGIKLSVKSTGAAITLHASLTGVEDESQN